LKHFEVSSTTEIKNVAKSNYSFKIFPNPANDIILIESNNSFSGSYTNLSLINFLGKIIYTNDFEFNDSKKIELKLPEALPSGYYQLVLKSNENTYQEKLSIFK
jgi:hypothetical protein